MQAPDGTVVMYCDAGLEFVADAEPLRALARAAPEGVVSFQMAAHRKAPSLLHLSLSLSLSLALSLSLPLSLSPSPSLPRPAGKALS